MLMIMGMVMVMVLVIVLALRVWLRLCHGSKCGVLTNAATIGLGFTLCRSAFRELETIS